MVDEEKKICQLKKEKDVAGGFQDLCELHTGQNIT